MIPLRILFFVVLIASTARATPCDTCECDPPFDGGFGRRIPPYAHYNPLVSPDGVLLYCDPGYILNLTDLSIERIRVEWTLCPAALQSLEGATWCAYDPEKLAIVANFSMDTSGGVLPRVSRGQLVEYRASTRVYKFITPSAAGTYGTTYMGIVRSHKPYLPWSPFSTEGIDTLCIGYRNKEGEPAFGGYYVPQTQAQIAAPLPFNDSPVIRRSSDYSMTIHRTGAKTKDYEYFLNDKLITLEPWIERVMSASFSPNKQLMALGVMPWWDQAPAHEQVWIYRVDDLSAPISKINFQKLHCTYSFWGVYPEFITDSTFAVSMHKDGDLSSPLWEIGLDGHIVRQLTFLPSSAVKESPPAQSIIRSVTVSAANTTLHVALSSVSGKLSIHNLLGIKVWEGVTRGSDETIIDVSQLSSGVYFLTVSSPEGLASERFVLAR